MITKNQAAEEVNQAINNALSARIPCYHEIRADGHPHYVYQSDLFGCVDTVTQIASERVYCNQSKSRADNRDDICIECRSFRGYPQNLSTGQDAPIAGAYWCDAWKRWLSPRFGQADTLTFYLPKVKFVGHYLRYYVEIMLSRPETWKSATGVFRKNDDTDTFIVFFNYREFSDLYMKTVSQTTYGAGEIGVLKSVDPGEVSE